MNETEELHLLGQSLWLANISRELLASKVQSFLHGHNGGTTWQRA